jgi:hypothetical protein
VDLNGVYYNKKGCQFKVLELLPDRKYLIQWLDNHAHKMIVSKDNAVRGAVRNPYHPSVFGQGFVGIGRHVTSANGEDNPISMIWRSIIQRCYDEKLHKRHPTYTNCTMDESWKNFQVFGDWYETNSSPGFDLDKDLLIKNNKHYSPDTCTFLPQAVNIALVRGATRRGEYPIGVTKSKVSGKYIAQAAKVHIGTFSSAEDAFLAYKDFKEQSLRILAKEYKEVISEKAYNALLNYRVEITD